MRAKAILGVYLFFFLLQIGTTPADGIAASLSRHLERGQRSEESLIYGIPNEEKIFKCSVGMRGGLVSNSDFSSSTFYSSNSYSIHYMGRLDNVPVFYGGTKYSGCWRPSSSSVGQWLQVDLNRPTVVTGVVTQGRPGMMEHDFVSTFEIQYGNSTGQLVTIREDEEDVTFYGNIDSNSHVFNYFPKPIKARYFRLVVQSWSNYISLRMDYLTC